MFILKAVKVLCFDTLLEVLILKGVSGDIIGRCDRDGLGEIGEWGFNAEYTEETREEIRAEQAVAGNGADQVERRSLGRVG